MTSRRLWNVTIAAIAGALLVAAWVEARAGRSTGSVSSRPRRLVTEAAKKVDRLVDANLDRQNVSANAAIDDETFVRRVYLDVIGRIPTAGETRAFLESRSKDKRQELIDSLLDSPGYSSHLYNYFADLLRVKTRLAQRVSGEPYIHFLKSSFAENTPYDELVRQLLTAEGPAYARDNGATGYYLRDREMPEDNMANTARVFLGTRLECAQCHDHPFDKWTQKQFFEMVAFTGGLRYRSFDVRSPEARQFNAYGRTLRNENQQAYRAYRQISAQLTNAIEGTGTGLARLPKEYQYDDAQPLSLVTAAPIFGPSVDLEVPSVPAPDRRGPARRRRARMSNERQLRVQDARLPQIDSRVTYAEWLTSKDNPRFAKVIVNRLWKRFFGMGLIEPVDDFKDDTRASNPQLLIELEKLMIELDFDIKQFQRVLLNTEAYQRAASTREPAEGEDYHFPGPLLRRMTAEQMWDSLLTLVLPNVEATIAEPGAKAEVLYAEYEGIADLSTDELIARIDEEAKSGRSMRERMMARVAEERRAELQKEQAKRRKARLLYRNLARARRQNDLQAEQKIIAQLAELGLDPDPRARRRNDRNLVRASELPSPAPDGHLIRQFGQSDREQIEASHQDANVPQSLTLLNGFLDEKVLGDKGSALRVTVAEASNTRDKIESIFLAILNRGPNRDERTLWKRDVDRFGEEALQDLAWTLVNCHEFRFIR
ncbi:MAG: DUF1549 domain-containing protein [Planctomycetota bacterium]